MKYRDPVCGMTISWEEATDFDFVGADIVYFCCPGCARRFRQERKARSEGDRASMWRARHPEVPSVGRLGLDTFERLVVEEWTRRLAYPPGQRCVCRTLERGLISLALAQAEADRHRLEILLAAEVARLRLDRLDHHRALRELHKLPGALRATLPRTGLCDTDQTPVAESVEDALPEILVALEREMPIDDMAKPSGAGRAGVASEYAVAPFPGAVPVSGRADGSRLAR